MGEGFLWKMEPWEEPEEGGLGGYLWGPSLWVIDHPPLLGAQGHRRRLRYKQPDPAPCSVSRWEQSRCHSSPPPLP